MPTGIIIKGIGGFYYVKAEDTIYECKARGIFRMENMSPIPGDNVFITVDLANKKGNIEQINPRENELIRPAVANVDQIIIVVSVKSPSPDYVLLDKLLITAELKGISPVICFNKIDLEQSTDFEEVINTYNKTGYRMILASLKTKEGYDRLKNTLNSKVTVFAGQSGVGKSTILNMLMDSSIMETGGISQKIGRGKHTTRHAELVELDSGGYIVDTPGFSSFELSEIEYNELELYYPEFSEYLNSCKYTGCSHISEPGCSIKQALELGKIGNGRYERYMQLYNLLKANRTYHGKGNKTQGKGHK